MKREEKRQRTKQLLLDTTGTLVEEKGCHLTTMSDIMERSGLSKGAIFHYVKSKDELLALVLQERLIGIDSRFFDSVMQEGGSFQGPMARIAEAVPMLEDPGDVTNRIVIYLLSKSSQSEVSEVLSRFYEQSVQTARSWIMIGQEHGVIPPSVQANKTAELFVLLSFGLRMRSVVSVNDPAFTAANFSELMADMLQPKVE